MSPRWIIEQAQLITLPVAQQALITADLGSVILADSPAGFGHGGSNAEHYTTIVSCSSLNITHSYVAKCLSLGSNPPPAGTSALLDLEGWELTAPSEFANQCATFAHGASLISAAGATMIAAPSDPTQQAIVQCAAQSAATTTGEPMVHLQTQPSEMDTPGFIHEVRQATRWAHDPVNGAPGITVSFGLSTNPKYGATAQGMFGAWDEAIAYLGPDAPCWLNIIPVTAQQAAKASRFLNLVYGT